MKIIKIIFLSLLALSLIFCAGVFIFFQTFDADQYLLKISQKASLALGRTVLIGHLEPGFSKRGITLDAGPLTIADDEDFTTQPFVKVDKVRISLDLKSLILRREVHITEILLQSPEIHFIRSQEGRINAWSIGHASIVLSEVPAPQNIPSPPSASVAGEPHVGTIKTSFQAFNIRSVKIEDASISFIDQSRDMPLDFWLLNINASLNDFSLSKPFQLSFNAAPLLLKSISPQTPDSPILKNIAGVLQLNMANLQNGSFGDLEINGNINILGGVIKNFNIFKTVLSHALGSFGGDIDNFLNGQLKDTLGAADTVIDKAGVDFTFHDKTLSINNFLIDTNIFEFTAKGSMDQGLNMDMQTMLHLNGDVSAALVSEAQGLKYLMDDSKRIAIGASLKGAIPHLKYKPNKDFRKKSKKMFMQEGGSILGALLGGR